MHESLLQFRFLCYNFDEMFLRRKCTNAIQWKIRRKFNASINTVEFGCGDKAVKIGGENVLPLYTFDAPIENAPKIGVMISDLGLENEPAGVKAYYEGCTTIGEIAKNSRDAGCRFRMPEA